MFFRYKKLYLSLHCSGFVIRYQIVECVLGIKNPRISAFGLHIRKSKGLVSFLVVITQCDSVYFDVELQDSLKINDINIYPAPELVPYTIERCAVALVELFAYNLSNFYKPNKNIS